MGTNTGIMSKEFRQIFAHLFLGVERSTSSAAALGECGRLPMAVHYHKRGYQIMVKNDEV